MRSALSDLRISFSSIRDVLSDMDANVGAALSSRSVAARFETTRCALAVVISGFLESFLRDVAQQFFGVVNLRNKSFDSLPHVVRFTHFIEGAKQLQEVAKLEKASKVRPAAITKATDIVRRLASPSGAPYEIVWEAFAETQANPGPKALAEYLRRFGIEDPLSRLSAKLRSGTISKTTIEVLLANFIILRNECAHTGAAGTIPSTTYLRDTCDFIDEVAEGVVVLLEELLANPPFA